jgi:hypothetical protein
MSAKAKVLKYNQQANIQRYALEKLQDQEEKVHLSHCNQGEYEGSCKYGQDNTCPALKKATKATTVLTHSWDEAFERYWHEKPKIEVVRKAFNKNGEEVPFAIEGGDFTFQVPVGFTLKKLPKEKAIVKTLIIQATKMTGLRSIPDTISYVEESLTGEEVKVMTKFLQWVKQDISRRSFGNANFWERFNEWQSTTKR